LLLLQANPLIFKKCLKRSKLQ